jgi:(E)-4-hydroxy-3-methyl-but-2-enyl pyrophosphate reductase
MIKIARTAGFCMGVKRAVDMVLRLHRKTSAPIYTDGPLIHNPQIVSLLEERGIASLKSVPKPSAGLIVIRAHGVSPERRAEIRRIGLPVHDATCPDVAKVQAIIKKYAQKGYSVVIVGDKGHAEVEGLLGFAGGSGFVVSCRSDIDSLPSMEKVCVVAQTTQDMQFFEEVAGIMRHRVPECVVFDTICDSTKARQKEIVTLARSMDAMIVVGGKNSANTARLVQICERQGIPVFHVEKEDELGKVPAGNYRQIGVAGGASTPSWVIERVVEKLRSCQAGGQKGLKRSIALMGRQLIMTHLFTAFSAAFLYASACLFQGVRIRGMLAFSLGGCILCLHLTNKLGQGRFLPHGEETLAWDYYREHRKPLAILAGVSGGLSLLFASFVSVGVFLVYLVIIASGLYYCFEKGLLRKRHGKGILALKFLPASKEVYVSLAWMIAIVLAPRMAEAAPWSYRAAAACGYVFALVFIRSTFRDIYSIQRDAIVGKETIPMLLGKPKTKMVMGILIVTACVLPLTAPLSPGLRYALTIPIFYIVVYLYCYHRRPASGRLLGDFLADSQFVVAGVSSLLGRYFFP